MCLRRITSFWRYHGCSKYMFRIAEEYIKTIKNIRTKTIFSSLEKIDFRIFEIFKNQNFEKKIWKIKINENRKFQNSVDIFDFWKFRFSDLFSHFFFDFWKFQKFWNFEIWKINFLQDEKIFFVRIFLYCLNIFFRNPKHVFRAPMIPSERCYSA